MRLLLSLFIFLLSLELSAQEIKLSILNEPLDFYYLSESTPVSLPDGTMYMIFTDMHSVYGIRISADFKLMSQFELRKTHNQEAEVFGKYDDLIQVAHKNGSLNIYFSNKRGNTISYMSYSIAGDSLVNKGRIWKKNHERFLQSYVKDGLLNVLTIKKKGDILKWYTIKNHSQIELTERDYDLSALDFNLKDMWSGLYFLNYKSNAEVFIENEVQDRSRFITPFKIYPRKQELLITLDHENDKTTLIKLSENTNDYITTTVVKHQLDDPTAKRPLISSNSFILKDLFIQAVVNNESFNLSVKDLEGNLKYSETFKQDNLNIDINSKDSTYVGVLSSLPFEENKEILETLAQNGIGLGAYEEGLIHITLSAEAMAPGITAGSFTQDADSPERARQLQPWNFEVYNKDKEVINRKVLSLSAAFDPAEETISNNSYFLSASDAAQSFIKEIIDKPHEVKTFEFGGRQYLGFYDILDRHYYIVEFNSILNGRYPSWQSFK